MLGRVVRGEVNAQQYRPWLGVSSAIDSLIFHIAVNAKIKDGLSIGSRSPSIGGSVNDDYCSEVIDLEFWFLHEIKDPRPTCLLFAASDNHAANRIGWSPLSVEYLCFHTGDAAAGITHGVALNDALASLKKSGQPIESDYPFQLKGPLNSPPAFSEDRLFRCDGKQLTATFDDITSPIASGHPVLIVMSISDAFYTQDLMRMCRLPSQSIHLESTLLLALGLVLRTDALVFK